MNRTAVEQIKERLPINEVIGQYVKLDKSGASYKAKCPFHNEKSASFFVSPDRGGYYCFGCGAKGDIFTFVEQFEGLDFRGALKVLAERAGVQLTFDNKADGERDRLFQIMEAAAAFFEIQFTKNKEVEEYVKKRGIVEKTRTEFRIGWAPEGWQHLIDFLRTKKFPDALIEKAGLGKKTEEGKFYDRFRGRVMFPINDSSGRVIAFSGRILKDDGKSAKYLNSPDTPLYDKSLVLYGLDKAKSDIRRLNYTIMVEGQMDLVMSHQAGIKNTVASSGTALTDESFSESGAVSNLGLVRRLSPNVIIAFDSDSAGRKAAMRAAGIGLSMGMDVKIADLVGGKDPADLVLHDPEDWKKALREAKPIIEFELGNVMRDNPDPRKIPRALRERVFPFLARIESRMDQAHFVKMIADRANITEGAVWDDLNKVKLETTKEGTASTGRFGASGGEREPAATRARGDGVSGGGSADGVVSQLDLIVRRMFGLLYHVEKIAPDEGKKYRAEIQKIAGDSYTSLMSQIEPLISDLTFEAEAIFGNEIKDWDRHMKELILNFEEDIINKELITSMSDLKLAEKAGDMTKVTELAKKCQVLSIRKAEVGKKKK
jgi:DNA primase